MTDNVVDMGGKPKGKKRPGRQLKETPADQAVRHKALENSGARLLEIVTGLEALADRQADLAADRKQRFQAAKSEGYSVPAIKALLRRRAATSETIKAQKELDLVVATYAEALEIVEC